MNLLIFDVTNDVDIRQAAQTALLRLEFLLVAVL